MNFVSMQVHSNSNDSLLNFMYLQYNLNNLELLCTNYKYVALLLLDAVQLNMEILF